MKPMEWYAIRTVNGQAVVRDEVDGRKVASVYNLDDAVLLALAPALLAELHQTRLTLMYAAQEARGRVKKEIIDAWIYQANKAEFLVLEASMDLKGDTV